MTKRNRNGVQRRQRKNKRPLRQPQQLQTMARFRFNMPNFRDCGRRLFAFLWNPFAVLAAVTGLWGILALTLKKRKDHEDFSDPETGDKDQTSGGNVPERSDEPLSVACHDTPTVTGERPVESSPEPAEEARKRPSREEDEAEEEEEEFDSRAYRVEVTDEFYCEYDSTWETEETNYETRQDFKSPRMSNFEFDRFRNAARDMQNYRHNYPSQIRVRQWMQPQGDKPNLNFYLGLRPSSPDDVFIEDFHSFWKGQYDKLEYVHTYIQWLFPLQEPGVNYQASQLTKDEIEEFLKNSTAKRNLLKSYELMLDFYGVQLWSEETGEVKRASNWEERFQNLNRNTHNNLRITRILKCLGTLGFAHYQAPLVRFFLEETLVHGQLQNVKCSVLNYFVFAVLDKTKRRELIKFAYLNYDRKNKFVWCPKKIQMMWSLSNHETDTDCEDDDYEEEFDSYYV